MDLDLRELERAWQAAPGDEALLERALAGFRRAGLAPPPDLLEARVQPGLVFDSALPLRVYAALPEGDEVVLGTTPCRPGLLRRALGAVRGQPVGLEVPRHRVWGVVATVPGAGPPALEPLLAEVERASIPGLGLEGLTSVSPAVLEPVVRLGHLREVKLLACSDRAAAGLPLLGELPELTRLDLSGSAVTPAALDALRPEWPLRLLALRGCKLLRDEALERVLSLGRLRGLALEDAAWLSDGAAARLGELASLTELDLTRCAGVRAAALAAIAPLPRLERLSLSGCRELGDPDLAVLAGAGPALRELDLSLTDLGPAGLDALAALPGLRLLRVGGCPRLDAAARARFRAGRPECHLDDERLRGRSWRDPVQLRAPVLRGGGPPQGTGT